MQNLDYTYIRIVQQNAQQRMRDENARQYSEKIAKIRKTKKKQKKEIKEFFENCLSALSMVITLTALYFLGCLFY